MFKTVPPNFTFTQGFVHCLSNLALEGLSSFSCQYFCTVDIFYTGHLTMGVWVQVTTDCRALGAIGF